MRSTCYVPSFNFFLGAVSEIEVQSFPIFPTWLPQHLAHDIIIINKIFDMSGCSYGENFASIWQAVVEKNTRVLCGQTNKQTDTNAIPSPSVRVKTKNYLAWYVIFDQALRGRSMRSTEFPSSFPRRRIRRGYCIWVRLFVCLFCLSAQNFRVFLHNRLSDWDEIFTIGATTRVECFNDNYDVRGHVVCSHIGKTEKLWTSISETAPRTNLKLGTWQVLLMRNECDFCLWHHRCPRYDIIIASEERHIRSVWKFEGHLGIKCATFFFDDVIGHVIQQPYCLFFFKPSKIFSEMAE